jgi:hypothetical protein
MMKKLISVLAMMTFLLGGCANTHNLSQGQQTAAGAGLGALAGAGIGALIGGREGAGGRCCGASAGQRSVYAIGQSAV